eukprot:765063-Hanusia_phi.AAC.2
MCMLRSESLAQTCSDAEAEEEEVANMFVNWSGGLPHVCSRWTLTNGQGKAGFNMLGEDVLIRIFSMLPVTKLCDDSDSSLPW